MADEKKLIAWLTEISLRPCDFTRDDYDSIETENLAIDAIEMIESAQRFREQRNNVLDLLTKTEDVIYCCHCIHGHLNGSGLCDCRKDKEVKEHRHHWFCADGERKDDA